MNAPTPAAEIDRFPNTSQPEVTGPKAAKSKVTDPATARAAVKRAARVTKPRQPGSRGPDLRGPGPQERESADGKDDQDEDKDGKKSDDKNRNKTDDGEKGHDKKGDDKKGDDKEGGDKEGGDGKDKKPKSRWPLIILAIVVVLAIVGALIYWLLTRNLEDTDDAYTEGNAVAIAPQVAGYVTELDIGDNTYVHAGDVVLRIDSRDYIAARDQAVANLALARAQLLAAEVDLEMTRVRAPANLQQAEAQLEQARANQILAARNYRRQREVDQRATTQTNVDQADTQLQSNRASVDSAQAQVNIADLVKQTIAESEDTVLQRQAQVKQAEASLEQAEVNLSYTVVRAPQDGRVTRRNVDFGTYLQAGQQVFFLVTPTLWITANFKETQLTRIRAGQKVSISVDAFPALKLHGHVDSIQQGSGDRFSTFPAENATGNYVKIVRRVPVKIIVDSGLDPQQGLPLGISVEPTVTVE